MKQFLLRSMAFLAIFVSSLVAIEAKADGLNISPFFKEDFAKNPTVTMVSMSGKQSDWKGLTSYQSVSVSGDDAQADAMARAVMKDGAKAEFKETTFKDGHLYFGFYGLGGEGRHRRYIFFLDMRPKGKSKTTLILIEADQTPEQVKQMVMEGGHSDRRAAGAHR